MFFDTLKSPNKKMNHAVRSMHSSYDISETIFINKIREHMFYFNIHNYVLTIILIKPS